MSGYALRRLRDTQPTRSTPDSQSPDSPRVIVLPISGSPTTPADKPTQHTGGGSGGKKPPTGFNFPEGEGEDYEDEEFNLGPLHPDLARQAQLREQEIEATRDFAKSLVAYWKELLEGGIPTQVAVVMMREYQQAEMNRLTNIDVHRLRFDNE